LSGSFSGDFRAVAALTEIIVSSLKQGDNVIVIMVHIARVGHTSMVPSDSITQCEPENKSFNAE